MRLQGLKMKGWTMRRWLAAVLLALALGVSAVMARRPGTLEGFGLLGLASVGPVIVVLFAGWLG